MFEHSAAEDHQGVNLGVGQSRDRNFFVQQLHGMLWVPAQFELSAPSTRNKFRHQPLSRVDSDLTVARIEIRLIGYVDNLVGPILYEQSAGGTVAFAEAVMVANGPTANRALARKARGTADGSETFAFGHP
jgi:hypothetical protein